MRSPILAFLSLAALALRIPLSTSFRGQPRASLADDIISTSLTPTPAASVSVPLRPDIAPVRRPTLRPTGGADLVDGVDGVRESFTHAEIAAKARRKIKKNADVKSLLRHIPGALDRSTAVGDTAIRLLRPSSEVLAAAKLLDAWSEGTIDSERISDYCGDSVLDLLRATGRVTALETVFQQLQAVTAPTYNVEDNVQYAEALAANAQTLTDAMYAAFEAVASEGPRAAAVALAARSHRLASATELAALARRTEPDSEITRSLLRRAAFLGRESLSVHAPLADRLGLQRVARELESLAFATVYPRQHKIITATLGERSEELEVVLQEATEGVKRAVKDDLVLMAAVDTISVVGRIKAPYSTWRKMHRQSRDTSQPVSVETVKDIVALRVVFTPKQDLCRTVPPFASTADRMEKLSFGTDAQSTDSLTASVHVANGAACVIDQRCTTAEAALCYHARSMVHRLFPHVHAREKDYLRDPKRNGYEALHSTCTMRYHGKTVPFEVQIRTDKMHQTAEYGEAAHYRYKRYKGFGVSVIGRGGVAAEAASAVAVALAGEEDKLSYHPRAHTMGAAEDYLSDIGDV